MTITPTDFNAIDQKLTSLQNNKNNWAALPMAKKIDLLAQLKTNIDIYAAEWAASGIKNKQIAEKTAGVGEEWISGPWATLSSINQLIETLSSLDKGETRKPSKVRTRKNGQVVAQVFPMGIYDSLLLNGVTGEVWMDADVTESNLNDHMASFYKSGKQSGEVCLVLGAGNISSIAPLDVIYKLIADGCVCLLKMNPVNEYLGPVFEKIFKPFIDLGFVEFVYGGADVGEYCALHDKVENIHITGSHKTHDAIVYGGGDEGIENKKSNKPKMTKPITSELGGCCPTIVVPGPWSEADLKYQAEHIVTQKYHNAGFNCVASQVLVLSDQWMQKNALVAAVESVFGRIPRRVPYYPGADERQKSVQNSHHDASVLDLNVDYAPRTFVKDLDSNQENPACFRDEMFGGVYSQTSLPGETALEFLRNAVKFCNEKLSGTLGANIIIHPATIKELGSNLEDCIADLKYGGIGVNAWSALAYLIPTCSWGAFPGHTNQDIQSGVGVVHNTLLFDKPQKSVVYSSFYPFPRCLANGEFHLSPRPPWFVTNKKAHKVGEKLARFEAKQGPKHIPGIFIDALMG